MNSCNDCNESSALGGIALPLLPVLLVEHRCSSNSRAGSCNSGPAVDARRYLQSRALAYWSSPDGPTGDQSSQTVLTGPTEPAEPVARPNLARDVPPPLFVVLVIETDRHGFSHRRLVRQVNWCNAVPRNICLRKHHAGVRHKWHGIDHLNFSKLEILIGVV